MIDFTRTILNGFKEWVDNKIKNSRSDWNDNNQMSPKKALEKLKANLHAGEILLLHPTSKTNATILKDFIQYAKAEGYRFQSLNELQ